MSPSPIAVPPATLSWRSASSIRARSVVGSTTCSAREPNLISPSRKSSGTWRVSVRAASRAAVRRSGRTSLASIEPDVSVTMITVASSRLAATVRSGRAIATSSAAKREQRQQRRQVAQRARRRDRGEDVDVRVADREPAPAPLRGDVGGDGQGQQPEADQHQWLAEAHACG